MWLNAFSEVWLRLVAFSKQCGRVFIICVNSSSSKFNSTGKSSNLIMPVLCKANCGNKAILKVSVKCHAASDSLKVF